MSYYLRQLQQSLTFNNSELTRLNKKLEDEKAKLKSIKNIIKDIKKDFDDVIGDIKKASRKTANYLEDGIKGNSKVAPLVEQIEDMKEASVEQDNHMSEVLLKLEAEKSRIENLISQLETQIKTTKGNIGDLKGKIDSENRRIEYEAELARQERLKEQQAKVVQYKKSY